MSTLTVDLNCDMGESFGHYELGNDAALLPLISSCNLACGFHAGDPVVMEETIGLALRHGVRIGAHPGYPDRQGFGRRAMAMSPREVRAMVGYQIGALVGMCRAQEATVAYLKPHGALYHAARHDAATAEAIVTACRDQGIGRVMGIVDSALHTATDAAGLAFIREGFIDRGYGADAWLLPRSHPAALIEEPERAAEQALRMVRDQCVLTPAGTSIPMPADSLCIHGDNPRAMAIATAVRAALQAAGVTIRA